MKAVNYTYDKIGKRSDYIFQVIKNRTLSNIYHSHDFYEFIIVIEGNCTQIINEEEVYAGKNTVMLLCPGDRHKFTAQSADVNVISLSVKKEEIICFENAFNLQHNRLHFFNTVLTTKQTHAFIDLYDCSNEYEYKLLLSNFIKIYIDTFRNKPEIPSALAYAMKEMLKPENLKGGTERLVCLSGYSQTHLARLMKKHFNISLHEYILNAKLEAAYHALILTNINTQDLSEELGYASFSHFQKIFKSKYGITPSALRKKHGSWTT